MLNVALFWITAKQWREKNPYKIGEYQQRKRNGNGIKYGKDYEYIIDMFRNKGSDYCINYYFIVSYK